MLELTPEGAALYEGLSKNIGKAGVDQVARYARASAEVQILIREEGAAGIEALHAAQGNVAAARQALIAARRTLPPAPEVVPAPVPPQIPPPEPSGERLLRASEVVRELLARPVTPAGRRAANALMLRLQPVLDRLEAARLHPERLTSEQRAALRAAEARIDELRFSPSNTIQDDPAAAARWNNTAAQVRRWASAGEPLTLDHIVEIHRRLETGSTNPYSAPGRLRQQNVGAGRDPRRTYVAHEQVEPQMKEFLDWYNANRRSMNPIELAAGSYQRLISIHPFTDANGRTTRLVMDWVLRANGLPESAFNPGQHSVAVFGVQEQLAPGTAITPDEATARLMSAVENTLELIPESVRGPMPSASPEHE
jgi:fido (protein-threonine AMPylation protein)